MSNAKYCPRCESLNNERISLLFGSRILPWILVLRKCNDCKQIFGEKNRIKYSKGRLFLNEIGIISIGIILLYLAFVIFN